jgi:hypothetical protein
MRISYELRHLLVYQITEKDQSPEFIFENLFRATDISLKYLVKLCAKIGRMTPAEVAAYLNPANKQPRGGGEAMLAPDNNLARDYLDFIQKHHRKMTITALTRKFHHEFYGEHAIDMPSLSTVYRTVKEGNTRKVISWEHIRQDPVAQLEFFEMIQAVSADRIVDLDGMVQTPEDFLQRYGYSPSGEECREKQIVIGGVTYAVHAAYTENGFMAWSVFAGTVTEVEVSQFVQTLPTYRSFNDRSYGLFDNASNQRTPLVRAEIESVFDGKYGYCSAYSPALKPIENGFSLVKRYIQAHWNVSRTPLQQINDAFYYYSDRRGQHGREAAFNSFDMYRRNHQLYLDLMH